MEERKHTGICFDCGGPLEIVQHGMNGMVFPTGDAHALAECMNKIIHSNDLLNQLRDGTRITKIPMLSDQIKTTESLYHKLLYE